jgi:hypothetical protein
MGDINQLLFIKKHLSLMRGPFIEIGSKDYGNTQDIKSLVNCADYVGVDMSSGKGVDIVVDMVDDFETINARLGGRRFNTAICMSVLEHVRNPFKMCSNISKLIELNGVVVISAPFSWRIHGYPSDYWRFTPEGLKILFPDFEFKSEQASLASGNDDEFGPVDNYMMRIDVPVRRALQRKSYGYLIAFLVAIQKLTGIGPRLLRYPYLFPPVTINMIGIKTK